MPSITVVSLGRQPDLAALGLARQPPISCPVQVLTLPDFPHWTALIESVHSDVVAFLPAGRIPLPAWLSTICAALGGPLMPGDDATGRSGVDGPDLVVTGAVWVDHDGLVTDLVLPDPRRLTRRNFCRYLANAGSFAVRRSALGPTDPATRSPIDVAILGRPLVRVNFDAARQSDEQIHALGRIVGGGNRPVRAQPGPVRAWPLGPPSTSGPSTTGGAQPVRDPVRVSVVLPARNAAATLPAQLAALAEQTYEGPWELVVVDNGSTDSTPAVVAGFDKRIPALRLVDAASGRGEGYARNIGVQVASGDLLAFCDADDVVAPDWLAALVSAARHADLVGGALDVGRLSPAWRDEQPLPMPEQAEFLPFARSANCAVWRDVLAEIGGWRAALRGGGEDMDLTWRVYLSGFRVAYAPDAVVHYRLRPRLGSLAAQKWRYGRSGARLYRTYRFAGMKRRPLSTVVGNWAWLVLHSPDLVRSAHGRRRWVRYAARLAGMAWGSLREKAVYL